MTVLGTLFDLPEDLIKGLKPFARAQSEHKAVPSQPAPAAAAVGRSVGQTAAGPAAVTGCIACGLSAEESQFEDAGEQREHFKSDWHRVNVKRRHGGHAPLTEQQFEALLSRDNDEVSSISGSSSDEDESVAVAQATGPVGGPPREHFVTPDGRHVSTWRCLTRTDKTDDAQAASLQAAQALAKLQQQPPRWAVVVSSGGHFAASIFVMAPTAVGKQQSKAEKPLFDIVAHKSFHRYVVRAKAGGRQSTQDATGKYAKSAGSQIRRENEALLTSDIRNILKEYSGQLGPDDSIFVQANGANAAAIFGGSDPPLSRADPRVRRIPFPTRRPTFAETKRVARILATVYLEEQPAQPSAQPQKQSVAAAGAAATEPNDRQPDGAAADTGQGRQSPLAKEDDAVPLPRLHRAVLAGDADKVNFLLESGHDPSERDSRGRTPYAVATHKPVRDSFRRYMAAHLEAWDYSQTGIPSALTEEMEQHQQARAAEKKARQRAKEKERKKTMAERKARQAEEAKAAAEKEVEIAAVEAASTAARVVGVRAGGKAPTLAQRAAASKQVQADREAAARRERAAAAAEARMKALQAAAAAQTLHHGHAPPPAASSPPTLFPVLAWIC